jgi:hypothetical protein
MVAARSAYSSLHMWAPVDAQQSRCAAERPRPPPAPAHARYPPLRALDQPPPPQPPAGLGAPLSGRWFPPSPHPRIG